MASETKERNALAVLAEEMKEGLDCLVLVPHLVKVYGKAHRIIAELAKVGDTSLIPQDCYGCGLLNKISVCRAIAEEGANNGNE